MTDLADDFAKVRAYLDGGKGFLIEAYAAIVHIEADRARIIAENADLRRQLDEAKSGDADLRQELAEIGHRVAVLDAFGALKETL